MLGPWLVGWLVGWVLKFFPIAFQFGRQLGSLAGRKVKFRAPRNGVRLAYASLLTADHTFTHVSSRGQGRCGRIVKVKLKLKSIPGALGELDNSLSGVFLSISP